jgi:hypothetical protein
MEPILPRKKIPGVFREAIRAHFHWSISTYYRKTKLVDLTAPPGQRLKGLTYTERRALQKVIKVEMYNLYKLYRSLLKKD